MPPRHLGGIGASPEAKYDGVIEAQKALGISHETIKKYCKTAKVYDDSPEGLAFPTGRGAARPPRDLFLVIIILI